MTVLQDRGPADCVGLGTGPCSSSLTASPLGAGLFEGYSTGLQLSTKVCPRLRIEAAPGALRHDPGREPDSGAVFFT